MRVHERLAAGEADLARRPPIALDLVEIARGVLCGQVYQRIVGRAALDIAGRAGEIAQRAGAQPQRLQLQQRNLRARRSVGGDVGIGELAFGQGIGLDREGRGALRRVAAFGTRRHQRSVFLNHARVLA
jgi:hypothetical protein